MAKPWADKRDFKIPFYYWKVDNFNFEIKILLFLLLVGAGLCQCKQGGNGSQRGPLINSGKIPAPCGDGGKVWPPARLSVPPRLHVSPVKQLCVFLHVRWYHILPIPEPLVAEQGRYPSQMKRERRLVGRSWRRRNLEKVEYWL